jgi:hypothetical protein
MVRAQSETNLTALRECFVPTPEDYGQTAAVNGTNITNLDELVTQNFTYDLRISSITICKGNGVRLTGIKIKLSALEYI